MTAYELNSTTKANEALAAIGGTGFGTTGIQLLKQLVVAAGVYRGSQFVGALDAYTTGLAGTWSVARRLLTGYTGPLIEVRRSTDDATLDIGYTETGLLDTVALLAFCGAGDGFLVTTYDQSGFDSHLTQANPAIQLRVVNTGALEVIGVNAIPAAKITGMGSSMNAALVGGTHYTGAAASLSAILQAPADSGGNFRYGGITNNIGQVPSTAALFLTHGSGQNIQVEQRTGLQSPTPTNTAVAIAYRQDGTNAHQRSGASWNSVAYASLLNTGGASWGGDGISETNALWSEMSVWFADIGEAALDTIRAEQLTLIG
jgi:hypothetical protein